ncbi:MAG: hypothetical protein WC175_02800 [Candidatus Dojkabacteria bacterium]
MGDKGHFWISVVKSVIRIAGFGIAIVNLNVGLVLLMVAELLGILEEVVDKRGK